LLEVYVLYQTINNLHLQDSNKLVEYKDLLTQHKYIYDLDHVTDKLISVQVDDVIHHIKHKPFCSLLFTNEEFI